VGWLVPGARSQRHFDGHALCSDPRINGPEPHKKALLERSANATILTDVLSGRFARALRNAFTDAYARTRVPVLPFPWQHVTAGDIYREATVQGNADYLPLWGGQSMG